MTVHLMSASVCIVCACIPYSVCTRLALYAYLAHCVHSIHVQRVYTVCRTCMHVWYVQCMHAHVECTQYVQYHTVRMHRTYAHIVHGAPEFDLYGRAAVHQLAISECLAYMHACTLCVCMHVHCVRVYACVRVCVLYVHYVRMYACILCVQMHVHTHACTVCECVRAIVCTLHACTVECTLHMHTTLHTLHYTAHTLHCTHCTHYTHTTLHTRCTPHPRAHSPPGGAARVRR